MAAKMCIISLADGLRDQKFLLSFSSSHNLITAPIRIQKMFETEQKETE